MNSASLPARSFSESDTCDLPDFGGFGLAPSIERAIADAGYTVPTPIQIEAIPVVLGGTDVLGLAQTGTGKTAAFVLPILQRLLDSPRSTAPRALIVVPTRELAEQVKEVVVTLGRGSGIRATVAYGGVSFENQRKAFRDGVDVVVACPGRLLDHIQQRTVDLRSIRILVLDEADQMFDMGFLPAIRQLVRALPRERQNLLFSATMPKELNHLAMEVLRNPTTVEVRRTESAATVSHSLYPVNDDAKLSDLHRLLGSIEMQSAIVFTRTKHRAKKVAASLEKNGFAATSLQGNLSQNARLRAMQGFRDGSFKIMVATDIAARGIDIAQVSHVVNFDLPDTVEAYVHRTGRTGRALRSGDAITLMTRADEGMVRDIERRLKFTMQRRSLAGVEFTPLEPLQDRPERPRRDQRSSGRSHRAHGGSQRSTAPQRGVRRTDGQGNGAAPRVSHGQSSTIDGTTPRRDGGQRPPHAFASNQNGPREPGSSDGARSRSRRRFRGRGARRQAPAAPLS